MRTAIALGSNLGDRFANLQAARQAILNLSNVKPPVLCSAIYETDPIGCEPDAGKFLNAVLEFDYEGDPLDLLKNLKEIESMLGRPPNHPRNISRTIDIDVLYCGDTIMESDELQLPHPRMHLRRFVLQPLADIRPDFVLPSQTKTVRELLAQIADSGKVIHSIDKW
jgi:2-amino-4-hydroxy-6-hydroxymethyldihydropteridine diphosphokinase